MKTCTRSSERFDTLPFATDALTTTQLECLAEMLAKKVAAHLREQPRLVSRGQIAAITSTSLSTIDRMSREGQIPCVRRGSRVLYDPADVIAAMKRL